MQAFGGQESLAPSCDPLAGLISQMAQGSDTALARLYDTTSTRVFAVALRILRDRPAAEEAALDAYTQAWTQAGRYDAAKGSVLAWLLNLARSRAIDLKRSRGRQIDREDSLEPILTLSSREPRPDQSWLETERADLVRTALARLTPEQRQALESVYFQGLTHHEAAQVLQQPLGTLKTRVRSGLIALRQHLLHAEEELA